MSVVSTTVRHGDPTIQVSGERRGSVQVVFTDGRAVDRNYRTADEPSWDAAVASASAQAQEDMAWGDAQDAADKDVDITGDYGESTKEQQAVAYLYRAYTNPDPYTAYKKFTKFNEWRMRDGLSVDEVRLRLIAAGLEEQTWDLMIERYQYLADPARVTIMEDHQSVVAGDTWVNR